MTQQKFVITAQPRGIAKIGDMIAGEAGAIWHLQCKNRAEMITGNLRLVRLVKDATRYDTREEALWVANGLHRLTLGTIHLLQVDGFTAHDRIGDAFVITVGSTSDQDLFKHELSQLGI